MASKKARPSSPVSVADRLGQRRRGEGAGGDDDVVPVGRRQAGTSPRVDGDQGMGRERRRHGLGKAVAVDRQRAAGGHLWRSAAAMISEPAGRISACSRPTALLLGIVGAEGIGADQFGQSSVWCASVLRTGRISCSTTGTPACGDLPGRFRARKAAADHMNRFYMGTGYHTPGRWKTRVFRSCLFILEV